VIGQIAATWFCFGFAEIGLETSFQSHMLHSKGHVALNRFLISDKKA
jgi:hypothetical protein